MMKAIVSKCQRKFPLLLASKQMSTETEKFINYFNLVKNYIEMEYNVELSHKMTLLKYVDIITPYIKNCIAINKSVPYTASGVVRFLNRTV